ncbi:MAG: hypothetical protein IPM47_11225 [Sphingobacteriales bacterium]|nr:MAG: hypothetical protein IPM47_11225 [Sphingobacteriales bacterium]
MKSFFTTLYFIFYTCFPTQSQPVLEDVYEADENGVSIRQELMNENQFAETDEPADSAGMNGLILQYLNSGFASSKRSSNCALSKEVYGYHPFWYGSSYYNYYDFELLSTFSYFSYELNPNTGGYKTVHSWSTTNSITYAQMAGCKVELCVTNFGFDNNARFLRNPKAWNNLADQLIKLLNQRRADGVNLDFEQIYTGDKQNLIKFVAYLHNRFKTDRPNTTITMAVPAIDHQGVFDVLALKNYVKQFVIMGYDYFCANSKHAGPVAPLEGKYSQKATLNTYLNSGVHPQHFILAVPYYGREWTTQSYAVPSSAKSYVQSPTYSQIKNVYGGKYKERWDTRSATPYIIKGPKDKVTQCWFENTESLNQKYDLVYEYQLGGVGIWALGYDNGHTDLWDLLELKFMDCTGNSSNNQRKPYYLKLIEDYFKN